MSKTKWLKNVPYVEAVHKGAKQRPSAISLRASWTTDDAGAALAIALAWHNPYNRIDSCHYVVDSATMYCCVPDNLIAFPQSPTSKGVVSINVCYDPPDVPTETTVERTAKLVAQLCKQYNIPVRILSPAQERAWQKHSWRRRGGIMLHTTKSFPEEEFMALVRKELS